MELLDLIDVADDMTQAAFIGKTYALYKDGKRQVRRTWQTMMSYMENSFHGYVMNLRQKMSESIFASRYSADYGKVVYYGWGLDDLQVDTSVGDGQNVTVWASNASGEKCQIRW